MARKENRANPKAELARKLASATNLLRKEGLGGLVSFARLRAARKLAGNTLSSMFPVMAHYTHPDGESICLYAGYRDYIKPLHFLAHTDGEGYRLFLRDNAESYILMAGLGGALQFISFITDDLHIEIKGKKILDVGCGDGALAYVLAAQGAAEVHGVDIDFSYLQVNPRHRDILKDSISHLPCMTSKDFENLEKNVKIYSLDIQSPTIDERFDIIVSNSVLEHIVDLRAALTAMHELLKPGGVMVHRFNPFFSETGGHEYCILDFPWGHVRLSREEIAEYLGTYRAWEKDRALELLYHSFNDPKLSLSEIDDFISTLGLEITYASERRTFSWKPDSEPSRILAQCRRHYPTITWRDLVSDTVVRVLYRNR